MEKCVILANFNVIVDSLDITLTIVENARICSKWLKKQFLIKIILLLEPIETRHHLEILISPRTKSLNYNQILNRLTKKAFVKRNISLRIEIKIKTLLLKKYFTFTKLQDCKIIPYLILSYLISSNFQERK